MKFAIAFFALSLLISCSSKKTIDRVDTDIENSKSINSNAVVGKKGNGDMVYQEKSDLVDYLIQLEKDVYGFEESIYGNKSYGNIGKYGVLENCSTELQKNITGKWGMVELPEKVILTRLGSPKKKIGMDEKKHLIVLSQEEITARIKRFEGYKETYENQEEWFDTEIKNCTLKLKNPEEGSASKRFPAYESN